MPLCPSGHVAPFTGFAGSVPAIWMIVVALMAAHWCSYFDDFLVVEGKDACPLLGRAIAFLLALLGWEVSDDKDLDFGPLAIVLGLEGVPFGDNLLAEHPAPSG